MMRRLGVSGSTLWDRTLRRAVLVKDFEYAAPTSLQEAVAILTERPESVKMLAGGTDIIVQLREGLREAHLVLDVKRIPDLLALGWSSDGGLSIGAAVPCVRLYRDEKINIAYSALTDAARIIGGWQIQSRASVGGNLCNASPAADSIPALIACGAKCHIVGPSGDRVLPVEEFCVGPGRNALAEGELLVRLDLPAPPARSASRYLRFIPRNEMDIAVVGAGVSVGLDGGGKTIEHARIALAAVGPTPVVAQEAAAWLVGKPATRESFKEAGNLARKAATPMSDKRGPASYRTHLVGVLTERALTVAAERATNGT
jgi:CO/xanthine dehydrogenase FAD-binding subunit